MFRRMVFLSALVAGLSPLGAMAAISTGGAPIAPVSGPVGIQLAQAGDVDIYYDEFGRRVVVDSYTGEVISVERPRRSERRVMRPRELPRQDRYYLDDPDDMARLERDRRGGARADDYQPGPDEDYYRGGAFPEQPAEAFPEAPGNAYPEQPEPQVVTREPIQRQPLAPPSATDPGAIQPGGTMPEPDTSIVPPTTGSVDPVPPVVQEPRLSLGAREEVAALQILLDRKGASPGVIDGRFGSNVDKAILSYRLITGENLRSTDAAAIKAALAATGGDPFTTYTITPEDAAGPYVASIPADYGEKAKLERMGFTSVAEMLGERFHMDEAYLKALNPEANFNRPGTIIRVANIGQNVKGSVARIVADKTRKEVYAYDSADKLIVSYPATIGSSDTPSPTGMHAVSRIALNPDYTYNPNLNFKQGDNNKILTIPPGPNGPVGSVWIALDKPTYGIHGTPDPSKIGKTESHGCVRLTNWDAAELAKLVTAGVVVEFRE